LVAEFIFQANTGTSSIGKTKTRQIAGSCTGFAGSALLSPSRHRKES
jgi:hypothetical protein